MWIGIQAQMSFQDVGSSFHMLDHVDNLNFNPHISNLTNNTTEAQRVGKMVLVDISSLG